MSRVHPHNQPSRGRPTLYVRNATFVRRNVPDLEVSADLTTEVTTACRFPPKLAASGVLSVIPSGRTPLLDAYSPLAMIGQFTNIAMLWVTTASGLPGHRHVHLAWAGAENHFEAQDRNFIRVPC